MNTAFRRILAAIACHASGSKVFAQALALAQQNNSHLILTHCTSLKTLEHMGTFIDAGFGLVSPAKLQRLDHEHYDEVEQAYQWLWDYALEARSHGVCAEVVHHVGEASDWICHLARQCQADLIVIGQSRKSRLRQRLFGCKTQQIVMSAPCSVVVVQLENSPHGLLPLEKHRNIVDTSHAPQSSARSSWNFSVPMEAQ